MSLNGITGSGISHTRCAHAGLVVLIVLSAQHVIHMALRGDVRFDVEIVHRERGIRHGISRDRLALSIIEDKTVGGFEVDVTSGNLIVQRGSTLSEMITGCGPCMPVSSERIIVVDHGRNFVVFCSGDLGSVDNNDMRLRCQLFQSFQIHVTGGVIDLVPAIPCLDLGCVFTISNEVGHHFSASEVTCVATDPVYQNIAIIRSDHDAGRRLLRERVGCTVDLGSGTDTTFPETHQTAVGSLLDGHIQLGLVAFTGVHLQSGLPGSRR